MDAAEWNGSVVLDDGLFLACDSRLQHKAVMRSNFSSAVAGGEGLFNLSLNGSGVFCIESDCPKEELVEITLKDDVLKVDSNFAIAWSNSLQFTVERSSKSLIGSAASGEGLVNVVSRHREGFVSAGRNAAAIRSFYAKKDGISALPSSMIRNLSDLFSSRAKDFALFLPQDFRCLTSGSLTLFYNEEKHDRQEIPIFLHFQ